MEDGQLRWQKGTPAEPNVHHLTFDGHRTLCSDVLVEGKARPVPLGSMPSSPCRSCQVEAERQMLPA